MEREVAHDGLGDVALAARGQPNLQGETIFTLATISWTKAITLRRFPRFFPNALNFPPHFYPPLYFFELLCILFEFGRADRSSAVLSSICECGATLANTITMTTRSPKTRYIPESRARPPASRMDSCVRRLPLSRIPLSGVVSPSPAGDDGIDGEGARDTPFNRPAKRFNGEL